MRASGLCHLERVVFFGLRTFTGQSVAKPRSAAARGGDPTVETGTLSSQTRKTSQHCADLTNSPPRKAASCGRHASGMTMRGSAIRIRTRDTFGQLEHRPNNLHRSLWRGPEANHCQLGEEPRIADARGGDPTLVWSALSKPNPGKIKVGSRPHQIAAA